jgi:hypothetical protein
VTARFISYLEKKSYYIAKQNNCVIGDRKEDRIAMTELFDLIAGTDTGAIIGGQIAVLNNDQDDNLVQKSMDFFENYS